MVIVDGKIPTTVLGFICKPLSGAAYKVCLPLKGSKKKLLHLVMSCFCFSLFTTKHI